MKPRLIVALLITIVNMSTASILFLNDSPRAVMKKMAPTSAVEIKWGDS
jgi:hypothetical protein